MSASQLHQQQDNQSSTSKPSQKNLVQLTAGFDIMRLYSPQVEDLNEDFICCICKKIVNNPLQCANTGTCSALICRYCIDQHQKISGTRSCKICNRLYVNQSKAFDIPSKSIMKILQSYQIICQNCKRPYPLQEVQAHETLHCQNKLCANELCGQTLEMLPPSQLVKFKLTGGIDEIIEQEKYACSKKCKKVARFGFILKHGTENEGLKAFENMMRKKMTKRNASNNNLRTFGLNQQLNKLTVQTNKVTTHRQNNNARNINQLEHSMLKPEHKRSISHTSRGQSMMMPLSPKNEEELKEDEYGDELQNLQQALLMSCLLSSVDTFHDFAWDPDHSSKEIQFSKDGRHAFLNESNYYFRTLISNRPFSDGVHYWEIVADARTEHELKVGITTQQQFNVNSSFSDYEFGFAYYGLGQLRHNSNSVGIPYGKQFKKKGILGVCLNMNQGTLSFALDGEYMGVAFEDKQLRKGPIYAAISLLHIGGCTLVACVEKPNYFP